MSFAISKNMHVSLTLGIIEFHSHGITMESASSQASNFGSPGFGRVPRRWLNLPFSLRKVQKLRPLKVVFPIQPVIWLNILQVSYWNHARSLGCPNFRWVRSLSYFRHDDVEEKKMEWKKRISRQRGSTIGNEGLRTKGWKNNEVWQCRPQKVLVPREHKRLWYHDKQWE